jgi:regulator of ribonuclease activity A
VFEAPGYQAMPDVQWSTSDLCDAHLGDPAWDMRVLTAPSLGFGGRAWYFGAVITATPHQAKAISLADILQQPGQGRVLLVQGSANHSQRLPLCVHALGTRPNRSPAMALCETGPCFAWAGVAIHTGDWVYADEDGIVLVNRRHAPGD